MFSESTSLYDLIYEGAGKDYDAETGHIRRLIRTRAPRATTLLDVACGTGQHIARMMHELECVGVDIEPSFLATAAQRAPSAEFHVADMRSFDLDRRYDVVTCLFASIGYMATVSDLRRAITTMARHLAPDGVLLLEACYSPEQWQTDIVRTVVVEHEAETIVRVGSSKRRGHVAELDIHYLVGRDGHIRHFTEQHELGLFTMEEYRAAFAAAGLKVEQVSGPSRRDLLIGTVDSFPGEEASGD